MKVEIETTKPIRPQSLSEPQVDVLLSGLEEKLFRSSMGWSRESDSHPGLRPVRIFSPSTIKSLHKKGLIDANFDDLRGFEGYPHNLGVQTLDGAYYEHSPESPKLQVWTNGHGRECLIALGLHPLLN